MRISDWSSDVCSSDLIRSSDGKALARWEGKPLEGFPETVRGRWLRRAAPILGDINLFKEELGEQWDWLMDEARWPPRRHVALGAVLFPEEVQHQEFWIGRASCRERVGQYGESW